MTAERPCPNCERPIPADSPYDLCPACLFEAALGEFTGSEDDTLPMQNSPFADTQTAQKPDAQSTSGNLRQRPKPPGPLRWLLIPPFVLLAIYIGLRLLYAQEHPRPSFWINEDMTTMWEHAEYGITPQHKLTQVNDTPVTTPTQARTQFDTTPKGEPIHLQFQTENQEPIAAAYIRFPNRMTLPQLSATPANSKEVKLPQFLESHFKYVETIAGMSKDDFYGEFGDTYSSKWNRRTLFDLEIPGQNPVRVLVDSFNLNTLWVRFASTIAIVALGLTVLWLKPNSNSSLGFLTFCSVYGVLNLTRSIPFEYRFPGENLTLLLSRAGLIVASTAFLVTFTPLRRLLRYRNAILGASVVFSIGILISAYLFDSNAVLQGIIRKPVQTVWAFGLLALTALMLFMDYLIRALRIEISPTDRVRSTLVRFAVVLAFTPTTIIVLLGIADFVTINTRLLSESATLIFPAVIGYAIVRHNLLQLNELAREGLLYGILIALVIGAYAVSVGIFAPLVSRIVSAEVEQWITPAVLIATILLVIPIHSASRRYLDGRFNRVPFEIDALVDTIDSLNADALDRQDYSTRVVESLARAVGVEQSALLVSPEFDDYWQIDAASGSDSTCVLPESAGETLHELLANHSIVLFDDLLDDGRFAPLNDSATELFEHLKISALFSLNYRGELLGALALGKRVDRTNFTAPQLVTLRRVSKHVAAAYSSYRESARSHASHRIVDMFPDYPARIGPYEIDGILGEGGMAYVYHGIGPTRQGVAVKVAKHVVQTSNKMMERFHREARAMQRLTHASIVSIIDVGWHDKEPYIALEYIPGGALNEHIRLVGVFGEGDTIEALSHVIEGLQYALAQQVIHRDIKPRNLFVTPQGDVKIGDFGIARIVDETTITSEGEVFGTPDYMAPEIVRGDRAGWKADQYALGITAFEMVTGKRPFHAENVDALLYQYLNNDIPSVQSFAPAVSDRFASIISRMCARDPMKRYESYAAITMDLSTCRHVSINSTT